MADTLPNRVVHIRSRDCSFTDGVYTVGLKEPIFCLPNEEIIVELAFASIPYSFFNVEVDYNNKLDIIESELDGSNPVSTTITLDIGNYNAVQLLTALQSNLNTHTGKGFVYSISYNKNTNQATFSTTSSNAKCQFLFQSGPNLDLDCMELLGFTVGDYSFDTNTTLKSNSTMNVSPYDAVYMRSSSFGITNNYETKNKGISDILAKIPINTVPFGFITWTNDMRLSYISTKQVIEFMEIRITDLDGNILNLRENPWTISIVFGIRKKPEPTFIPLRPNQDLPIQIED
jgi:hypothetical protein